MTTIRAALVVTLSLVAAAATAIADRLAETPDPAEVEAVRQAMRAALVEGTPEYDRLVCEWLERSWSE